MRRIEVEHSLETAHREVSVHGRLVRGGQVAMHRDQSRTQMTSGVIVALSRLISRQRGNLLICEDRFARA